MKEYQKSGAIQFRNNTCWVLGANNRRDLQGRSTQYLFRRMKFGQWPTRSLFEAFRRITAYKWKSKIVLCSPGGIEKDSTVNVFGKLHHVRCGRSERPDCKTVQPYKWEQRQFPGEAPREGRFMEDLDLVKRKTTYKCCSVAMSALRTRNKVRQELNATGRYVSY
jgi:hypothetical protein